MTRARDVANLIGSGNFSSTTFTATAGQTAFTISHTQGFIQVFMNGLLLDETADYTSNGSAVTLTSGAAAGDEIEVVKYNTFSVGDAIAKNGGTFTGDVTFAAGADIITASAGTDTVRIGENAGDSIVSGGNNNVTIGKDAGTAITTATDNTIVGSLAFDAATTAAGCTMVGKSAGSAITTGGDNTGLGKQALENTTSGTSNTAVGKDALEANTTASNNTATGFKALEANTTGGNNTAVGSFALTANTTGSANTAIGNDAMDSNTEGEKCTAVGVDALQANTTGTFNTAVGWSALQAVTTGDHNVAVGAYAAYNNEGEYNTVVGHEAYIAGVSGDYNSCFGYKAGENITTSSDKNTCIGAFAGSNMTSSATNNVMLGYDTATNAANDDYQIIIGTQMNGVGPEYITMGNNSRGRIYNLFSSNASWTRTSDERIKKDIQTNTDCGLAFINDLRTVTYKWKAPSEHPEEFLSYDKNITEASYKDKMYGFIAQEVKAAMDTHNITGFNGWHVTPESQGSQQGVSYEMFVMPLVKAVQELSAKVDALETKVAALEGK